QSHQVAAHFLNVLDALLADPTQPVRGVSLLSAQERQRVLVEFNRTEPVVATAPTVCDLFEAQAARAPQRPAVSHEGHSLTYGELNARANQVAHHLRGLGVGPETRVGVCLERSVELVVALLGVIKAGGAYVPWTRRRPGSGSRSSAATPTSQSC